MNILDPEDNSEYICVHPPHPVFRDAPYRYSLMLTPFVPVQVTHSLRLLALSGAAESTPKSTLTPPMDRAK